MLRSHQHAAFGVLGAALAFVTFVACGSSTDEAAFPAERPEPDEDAGGATGPGFGDAAGNTDAADTCIAPDMLIALDRTQTMHRTTLGATPPNTQDGYATSKWSMAITGIEQFTAPPFDQGIRFGLELWPKADPGCVTLATRIGGTESTNPKCMDPEIVVDTELGTGAQIAQKLDPLTTPICFSTPTGSALVGARTYLAGRASPGRKQFVMLVTDGADWEASCADPNPLEKVDELTTAGIMTVVVGFSAEASLQNGVGAAFLNDMACAGGAAKNFASACEKNAAGFYRAKNPDAGPQGTLFYVATNPAELATSMQTFAKTVCCDCVK
jgi:hypothetical protein